MDFLTLSQTGSAVLTLAVVFVMFVLFLRETLPLSLIHI